MQANRTATQIIEDIQKLNVDDVFKAKLNEYFNEHDNIKQRKNDLNKSINCENVQMNIHHNVATRHKNTSTHR